MITNFLNVTVERHLQIYQDLAFVHPYHLTFPMFSADECLLQTARVCLYAVISSHISVNNIWAVEFSSTLSAFQY
jgi:hypothetical protein